MSSYRGDLALRGRLLRIARIEALLVERRVDISARMSRSPGQINHAHRAAPQIAARMSRHDVVNALSSRKQAHNALRCDVGGFGIWYSWNNARHMGGNVLLWWPVWRRPRYA